MYNLWHWGDYIIFFLAKSSPKTMNKTRKYHNNTHQTKARHIKEEPQKTYSQNTPGRQLK